MQYCWMWWKCASIFLCKILSEWIRAGLFYYDGRFYTHGNSCRYSGFSITVFSFLSVSAYANKNTNIFFCISLLWFSRLILKCLSWSLSTCRLTALCAIMEVNCCSVRNLIVIGELDTYATPSLCPSFCVCLSFYIPVYHSPVSH